MSVNGFRVNGDTVRYNYAALDNVEVSRQDILDSAFCNFAEVFSSSKTYSVGDYAFHDGSLYRCVFDISTGENWTEAHWTLVLMGEDIRDSRESLEMLKDGKATIFFTRIKDSYPNRNTGAFESYQNWDRTDYIPVTPGEKIYVTNIYVTNDNCFYDSEKHYVSSFTIPIGSPWEITVPPDAAYMVCSNSAVSGRFFTQTSFYRIASWIAYTDQTVASSVNDLRDDVLVDLYKDRTVTLSGLTYTSGYMGVTGDTASNSTYFYTSKIPVNEGDIIYPLILPSNVRPIRFVCAFNGDTAIADKGVSSEITNGYTVPGGVTHVVLTCYAPSTNLVFQKIVHDKTTGFKPDTAKRSISVSSDVLSANYVLSIPDSEYFNNKKNCAYSFWGELTTADSQTLTIGHGTSYYNTTYFEINSTKVIVKKGQNNTVVGEYTHGLTFSDFISVSIKVDNGYLPKALLTIDTNGGQFQQEDISFDGSYGSIFVESSAGMTNVKLNYTMFDLDTDMMIFGDSYTSLNDINKWPYHVMNKGFNKFMLCGYSGASSAQILNSFKQMIYMKRPRYIAWFLGMNDADGSSTYNSNWKSSIDYVIETANSIGSELILATIPNTPTVNNTYKNAWVRNSGYRYVDFAKAVGAESSGSSWYSGMLSNDNVHPTQYGARVLAARLLVDMPETK